MRLEASFICDDIRSEEGRKVSLMGLYDEKLLLAQLPARLGKLCLYQKWSGVPIDAKVSIELRGSAIVTPVRTELRRLRENLKSEELQRIVTANLHIAFSPLDIAGEGDLEFLTFWEGSSTPQHTHRITVAKNLAIASD